MPMMIEVPLYGSEIGQALAANTDELFYVLDALADWDGEGLGREMAGCNSGEKLDVIVASLRAMADGIEKERAR